MNFNVYPRADSVQLVNDHDIYRVWKIPGVKNSRVYEGSGIEKTYNMAAVDDQDFPDDEEACPSLNKFTIGNIDKNVMRKKVEHSTNYCEECGTAARKDPRTSEIFCPECGLVMDGGTEHLEYTAAGAGRYDESEREQ